MKVEINTLFPFRESMRTAHGYEEVITSIDGSLTLSISIRELLDWGDAGTVVDLLLRGVESSELGDWIVDSDLKPEYPTGIIDVGSWKVKGVEYRPETLGFSVEIVPERWEAEER